MRSILGKLPLLLIPTLVLAGSIESVGFGVGVQHYEGNTIVAQSNAVNSTVAFLSTCVVSTAIREICGTAIAAPGYLGAQSSNSNSDPTTIAVGLSESANAFAAFIDVLTVQGLASGNYTLIPTIQISGSGFWNHAPLPGSVQFGFRLFNPDGTVGLFQQSVDATGPAYTNTFVLPGIPFEPGTPFNFKMDFGTGAFIGYGTANSQNTYVEANFLSTLRLTGLEVRDGGGDIVAFSNFNILAGSGVTYDETGVVPEPSTLMCAAGAVAILVARLARQRRRCRKAAL